MDEIKFIANRFSSDSKARKEEDDLIECFSKEKAKLVLGYHRSLPGTDLLLARRRVLNFLTLRIRADAAGRSELPGGPAGAGPGLGEGRVQEVRPERLQGAGGELCLRQTSLCWPGWTSPEVQ